VKRGFKANAERIATEIRGELNLQAEHRLDPFELAEHLAIPVLSMQQASRANSNSSFSKYFSLVDPDSFSAVTVFNGYRRLIVHNETHHPNRQVSNLTHEVSHSLLEHEPTPTIAADGQRYWDADVEEEATWLGAALLIPRDGALDMAKSGQSTEEIAAHYAVSPALCRWRISQSGIAYQVQHWKKMWRN
jgi:Zn-dependent peptidase ImmA (M78 family)